MNTTQDPSETFGSSVLKTGFIAGSLDIIAACVSFYISTGKNPILVLNYVASGVFGKADAYAGGTGMALLGLLFHYLIAYLFTFFFFMIYPTLKLERLNKFILAFIYGLFVWTVMNKIIVPLSNTPPPPPFQWQAAIKGMLILVVMIGLPNSLRAGKYYAKKRSI